MNDPKEIRKHLLKVRFEGCSLDPYSEYSHRTYVASSLVNKVMDMAESEGLSGEDTMTLLAYNALLKLEQLLDSELKQRLLNTTPPSMFVCSDCPKKANLL